MLRQLWTALIIFPAIAVFLLHGMAIKLLFRDGQERQQRLIRNVSRYSRFALRILRTQVQVEGLPPSDRSQLMVCNHLSYLDLMVIAATVPTAFVTSIDMGEIFFLGTMAEIGGSLFIERRHRERIGFDIQQIANCLNQGFHVVLFPEGTSSCGEAVLPFKRSLLLAASHAGKEIRPVTLRYTEINGEAFSPLNRDRVCWYGRMGFLPHFWSLLNLKSVTARLQFHPAFLPRPEDSKDYLAEHTHRMVAATY